MPPHGVHPQQAAKELKAAKVTSPVHKFIQSEAQTRGYTGVPSPPVSAVPKGYKPGKKIDLGPQPLLGFKPKNIAGQQAQLGKVKKGIAKENASYAAMVNPLSHQNLQYAAENATGYHEIAHIRNHPIAGTLALAGILPFGKAAHLADLGVEAARGTTAAERATKAVQAAEDASGLRKIALQRKAVRLSRRTTPEEAHAILQTQAENATARATKAARKNPQFLEHLPGEARPETAGALGVKVREAMRGADKVYAKQKELQKIEGIKRAGALRGAQKTAKSVEEELAGARKALAGEKPTVPFHNFESLRPHMEAIRAHLDTLNMLPHDRNRLLHAIEQGVNGKVPAPNQRKLIESVFGKEVKQLSPEAIKERGIGQSIADVGNIPRAIMSSADLSGLFRQNLAAIFHNPRLVFSNYHEVLHAAFSESKFQELMQRDVYSNPLYHIAKESGVPFTEIGTNINKGEEGFTTNIAEHLHEIPGIRKTPLKYPLRAVSAVVRGSDRNYVYLLNRTRMFEFETFAKQAADNGWRLDGPQGEKLRKQLANTVATLTGRGNWGKNIAEHRATYNMLFFSPGLIKSRLDLLNPAWYVHAEPFVRQERLKVALKLYGTLSLILWSAKMAGAKVSTDPTNADFGKIRVGNTRIDPAGGLTQYMRLIGQLYEGKITSSTTGKVEALSNGPFKTSRGNVIQQFARNKFAPVPGFVYNAAFGPGIGQKLTPGSVAANNFVPLLIQDMAQISRAHGPGGGPGMAAATFLPDLFGMGVQNYAPRKPKSKGGSAPAGSSYGGSSGGSGSSYGGSTGSSGSVYGG